MFRHAWGAHAMPKMAPPTPIDKVSITRKALIARITLLLPAADRSCTDRIAGKALGAP